MAKKKEKIEKTEQYPQFETITNSDTLSGSVRAIRSVLNDATLVFDVDGLKIKEVSNTNSACVNFLMKAKKFDKYQLPKRQELTVNLEQFQNFYDRCKSGYGNKVRFTTDGGNLILEQLDSKNRITKEYRMPLYERNGYEEKAVDDIEKTLEGKTEINMPLSRDDFRSSMKDLELVAEKSYYSSGNMVELIARKDFLIMTAGNGAVAKSIVERYSTSPEKDLRVLALKDYQAVSHFGFNEIQNMSNFGRTDFTDKFDFKMGNNNPLQLIFRNNFDEKEEPTIILKLTLANKIGEEEEYEVDETEE